MSSDKTDQWLTIEDPVLLFQMIQDEAHDADPWPHWMSSRKLRLFALSSWRNYPWDWHVLGELKNKMSDDYALINQAEWMADQEDPIMPIGAYYVGTRSTLIPEPESAARYWCVNENITDQHKLRCELLREIFGNPWKHHCLRMHQWNYRRPDKSDPLHCQRCGILARGSGQYNKKLCRGPLQKVLSPRSVDLAEMVYTYRDNHGCFLTDQLGILADSLEDDGCEDADLMNHLRGPGKHYLGCWAIDLITRRN